MFPSVRYLSFVCCGLGWGFVASAFGRFCDTGATRAGQKGVRVCSQKRPSALQSRTARRGPAGSDVPKPLATGETVDARCLPSTWTCSSAFGMPSMKLFISLIVEIPLRSSGPSLAQYSVPVATSHVPVRGVRPSNGRAPVTPPLLARDPAISVVLVARAHVEYFGRRAAVAMPGRLRCRLDRRNARKMTHASEIQPPEPARMSSVRAA